MNCKEFQNDLFDYLDDKLPQEARKSMEDHAEHCRSCTAALDRSKALNHVISMEKAIEPNPFIQTRILQKLEGFKTHHPKPGTILLRPVLLTLGLIVALTAGFFIGNSGSLRKSQSELENQNIKLLRSGLFVRDFADEDITLIDNE